VWRPCCDRFRLIVLVLQVETVLELQVETVLELQVETVLELPVLILRRPGLGFNKTCQHPWLV
jgi:hypothetical protein